MMVNELGLGIPMQRGDAQPTDGIALELSEVNAAVMAIIAGKNQPKRSSFATHLSKIASASVAALCNDQSREGSGVLISAATDGILPKAAGVL
jgi:hypothetical protein